MTQHPATATFAEFARILDCKPAYVTQLRKAGRLVLEGRRVKVAESLEKIEATRDPDKLGVRRRHAAARGAKNTTQTSKGGKASGKGKGKGKGKGGDKAGTPTAPPPPESGDAALPGDDPDYRSFNAARARKAHWDAEAAERDFRLRDGELMEAADVVRASSTIATQVRARLERMPNILAAQLAAETDENRARSLMADYVEETLGDLERALHGLAREKKPT